MQQNVDLVRRAYEAFGRGDLDALLSTFDDNIQWNTPGPSDLPTAGRRRGRQEVARFFHTLNDLVQIDQFTPREFIAQGDRVVVTGDEVARLRNTGKVINLEWAHVFEIRDGRVVAFNEYLDTCAVVSALREAVAAPGA